MIAWATSQRPVVVSGVLWVGVSERAGEVDESRLTAENRLGVDNMPIRQRHLRRDHVKITAAHTAHLPPLVSECGRELVPSFDGLWGRASFVLRLVATIWVPAC